MLAPLGHLTDAAGTPPYMRLRVDENWRSGRVAVGNPLCREAVDIVLGDRDPCALRCKKLKTVAPPASLSARRRDRMSLRDGSKLRLVMDFSYPREIKIARKTAA
jgi:hypothetical protein